MPPPSPHTSLRAMAPWQSNDWPSGGQETWSGQQGSWQSWHGGGWHHRNSWGYTTWQGGSDGGGWQQHGADIDSHMASHTEQEQQDTDTTVAEKELFWSAEEISRQRNTALTPFEKHQLLHTWDMSQAGGHVNRLISNFTNPRGAGKTCKHLMRMYMAEQRQQLGQMVSLRSPAFTLCKHMWVSMCRSLTAVSNTPEQPSNPSSPAPTSCLCLPATALMMAGCIHKKMPLHTLEHQMGGLCASCSKCIRCGGFLGSHFGSLPSSDVAESFRITAIMHDH